MEGTDKNRYHKDKILSVEEGEQLENYTKYKLKSSDELASVLERQGQSVCDCLQQVFQGI